MMKNTKKMKNKIFAIPAAAEATTPNPSNPPITAITKKPWKVSPVRPQGVG